LIAQREFSSIRYFGADFKINLLTKMEKQQELRKKISEIMKLGLPKQEEAKRIQELHWKKPEAKPEVAGDD
jgi:hypothetical protein